MSALENQPVSVGAGTNDLLERIWVRGVHWGAGIYVWGRLMLRSSMVTGNSVVGLDNDGSATIAGSYIGANTAGGLMLRGDTKIENSTIAGNTTVGDGGGIFTVGGVVELSNVTITGNRVGIDNPSDWMPSAVTLRNSILAGNPPGGSEGNCTGAITSLGYNLLGATAGCTFGATSGDLTNADPQLGPLIAAPIRAPYYVLTSPSPAIDAGDPAGCIGSSGRLDVDQRGAPRAGRCDIGAYEYTPAGSPSYVYPESGTPQHAAPLVPLLQPLRAGVLDAVGSPVPETPVTFAGPQTGPGGVFVDTGTYSTTVLTQGGGITTAPAFIPNDQFGAYTVTARAPGVLQPAAFLLADNRPGTSPRVATTRAIATRRPPLAPRYRRCSINPTFGRATRSRSQQGAIPGLVLW